MRTVSKNWNHSKATVVLMIFAIGFSVGSIRTQQFLHTIRLDMMLSSCFSGASIMTCFPINIFSKGAVSHTCILENLSWGSSTLTNSSYHHWPTSAKLTTSKLKKAFSHIILTFPNTKITLEGIHLLITTVLKICRLQRKLISINGIVVLKRCLWFLNWI